MQTSFCYARSNCHWFPYSNMLQKILQIVDTQSSQYIAFLATWALKNIIRYLKIRNIQNVKGHKLKKLFLGRKNFQQPMKRCFFAGCLQEREGFYTVVTLYICFEFSPQKREPITSREKLASGKRMFQNNLNSNVFLKLP